MNFTRFPPRNSSFRRPYLRRKGKGNRTRIRTQTYLPITTAIFIPHTTTITIFIQNTTSIINTSLVPINDLFAPLSNLTQKKIIFLIGLSLLILLCLISILFLIILKCIKRKNGPNKKRFDDIVDFLDDQHGNKSESVILLNQNGEPNLSLHGTKTPNGKPHSDNISNTISLDPMLEQKIIKNNRPDDASITPMADDTSIDTLRGSLISSPSQNASVTQSHPAPNHTATIDSIKHSDEAEKDDGLDGLVLHPISSRYTKAITNSGNPLGYRTSGSSLEQSIRRQQKQAEEEERRNLHGSNSNIYVKELQKEAIAQKPHTKSQMSLASRTSEDSCY